MLFGLINIIFVINDNIEVHSNREYVSEAIKYV